MDDEINLKICEEYENREIKNKKLEEILEEEGLKEIGDKLEEIDKTIGEFYNLSKSYPVCVENLNKHYENVHKHYTLQYNQLKSEVDNLEETINSSLDQIISSNEFANNKTVFLLKHLKKTAQQLEC